VVIMPKKDAARASAEPTNGDAVQRVVVGDAVQGHWNAFAEWRWKRRHQLLPSLELEYPDADEMRRIANLAKVRDTSAFAHSIESIILDAHLNDRSFRTLSIPKVREALNDVAAQAELLMKTLTELDLGSGSKGSLMEAGRLIEMELYALENLTFGRIMQLPEYLTILGALNTSAQRAASKPIPSTRRGAGGNPAFDTFIEQLLMAARMHGGKWTNYRSANQEWTGTLLKAVEILRKYLPQQQFFPSGVGRAVDHIRDKLSKHIDQFEPSSGCS
jgi:hypothetical protein